MSAELSSDAPSSFDGYDHFDAQYRECVLRCQQANDQLKACESEMRKLGLPVNTEREFPGMVPNLGVNIGRLSSRELEVFTLIGCGLTMPQIRNSLAVSVSTVETYRERLKAKLNIPSGPTLVRQAVLWFNRN